MACLRAFDGVHDGVDVEWRKALGAFEGGAEFITGSAVDHVDALDATDGFKKWFIDLAGGADGGARSGGAQPDECSFGEEDGKSHADAARGDVHNAARDLSGGPE
jgi:hypothetical protein